MQQKKSTVPTSLCGLIFFPEDIDFNVIPKETNVFLVYGIHDEYLTEERISGVKKQIAESSMNCKIITFDGPHDIPKQILMKETIKNNWG